MTTFIVGRPITTTIPEVVVDAGLALGSHRFQLVVVDNSGNISRPSQVLVQVSRQVLNPVDPITPVAPIRPAGPVPRALEKTPSRPRRTKK